jgi:serine phosphatase RsbU (regulator of sigma subunit)
MQLGQAKSCFALIGDALSAMMIAPDSDAVLYSAMEFFKRSGVFGETALARLFETFPRDVNEPVWFESRESVIPVRLFNGTVVFFVVENSREVDFCEHEREFVKALAQGMGLAIGALRRVHEVTEKARLRTEILAAESVQQTLLPHPADVEGVHVRTFSCLASEIGGDWFGYYYAKESHRLFFFVGDVTGHGVPSAIISGVACGAVYACEKLLDDVSRRVSLSPEEQLLQVASSLNHVIFHTGRHVDRLMTMVFCCLDVSTGQLSVVNAGHPHPFVIRPMENKVENVVLRGSRLGASLFPKWDVKTYELAPGDSVFLYSDGLLENATESGVEFSHHALRKYLEAHIDADDMNAVVLNHCNELWGEKAIMPDDDVSLLTITWEGKKASSDTWGMANTPSH